MKEEHTLVSRKRLEFIAYNYEISTHARDRLKERRALSKTIRESILTSPLAWRKQTDHTIKIAFSKNEFIVVEDTTGTRKVPVIITYINLENSDCSVIDKFIEDYKENLLD